MLCIVKNVGTETNRSLDVLDWVIRRYLNVILVVYSKYSRQIRL